MQASLLATVRGSKAYITENVVRLPYRDLSRIAARNRKNYSGTQLRSKASYYRSFGPPALGAAAPPPPPPRTRRQKGKTGSGSSQLSTAATSVAETLPESELTPEHLLRPVDDTSSQEAILATDSNLPNHEDYPDAPAMLFTSAGVVNSFHNLEGQQVWTRKVQVEQIGPSDRPIFQATVSVDIPTHGVRETTAEGSSKKSALLAAHEELLLDLHESGILTALFSRPPDIDVETSRVEADAKVDIYNYCARFGLLPTFTLRMVPNPRRPTKQHLYEVQIGLPEQNILAVSSSANVKLAEVSACIKFKEQAENFHNNREDNSDGLNESSVLSLSNRKAFFDFYKLRHRDAVFNVTASETEDIDPPSGYFQAQVYMNGNPVGVPILLQGKKKAEEVAFLAAAVYLSQNEPGLLEDFTTAMETRGGDILAPAPELNFSLGVDTGLIMRQTLREVRALGLPDAKPIISGEDGNSNSMRWRHRRRAVPSSRIKDISRSLLSRYQKYKTDPKLAVIRKAREALPISQYRSEILQQVENNVYSIVIGATGSGKTTQVPQLLVEDAIQRRQGAECNVICTQPRRIAAISVARRVAKERNEELRESVGYQIRFDASQPRPGGSITYCTTGILLQQIQQFPDEILDNTSHIIIDEVHERDIIIDFLLAAIKKAISRRLKEKKSAPKVVLMSATIESDIFEKYLADPNDPDVPSTCPTLTVPGRSFPVTEMYLESLLPEIRKSASPAESNLLDSETVSRDFINLEDKFRTATGAPISSSQQGLDMPIDWKGELRVDPSGASVNEREQAIVPIALIATTISHIMRTTSDGAILVFIPGIEEILQIQEQLHNLSELRVHERATISILHSLISPAEQERVFEPAPPGKRKIILSTNIAETSVTIPDVKYVVDSGKMREKRYDQSSRINRLICTWISQSNARQRAGRAGRVQDGHYYALFSRKRYESLRPMGVPEMLRSDLQELCLDIKAQALSEPIGDFLASAIEPPSSQAVASSVRSLTAMEALTPDEELTALGRVLALLPVHPSLGKMIILGIIFRCLDPVVILGAAINERSLFISPINPIDRAEAKKMQKKFVQGTESDHIAVINAFRILRERDATSQAAMIEYASENFLHVGAFRSLHATVSAIQDILERAKLIPPANANPPARLEVGTAELNANASNISLTKAIIVAGLYPNIAAKNTKSYRTQSERHCIFHPACLSAPKGRAGLAQLSDLISYTNLTKPFSGSTLLIRDITSITPLMAILFGGRLQYDQTTITMDDWLPFTNKSSALDMRLVVEFRKAFDRVLTSTFDTLTKRADSTGEGFSSFADAELLRVFASGVVDILTQDTYRPTPRRRLSSS